MPTVEQLHPMALHFPIVLIFMLAAVDLFALWRKIPLGGRATYASFAAAIAIAAGASALLTASLGDMAAEIAAGRGFGETLTGSHEMAGNITSALFAIWAACRGFVWWRSMSLGGQRAALVVVVDLLLVLAVLVTAYLGGQLVYEHGVNVMAAGR